MLFQEAPWLEASEEYKNLVYSYNIEWIKENANLQRLNTEKVPFLTAVIQSIQCVEKKPVNLKLRDLTGNIDGCMISDLYKEYSDSLVTGSVLVLHQFGVLTTRTNNHFLTITPKNLVAIYSINKDNSLLVQKLGEINENRSNTIVEKAEKIAVSESVNKENAKILANLLEGIDANSFFEDF